MGEVKRRAKRQRKHQPSDASQKGYLLTKLELPRDPAEARAYLLQIASESIARRCPTLTMLAVGGTATDDAVDAAATYPELFPTVTDAFAALAYERPIDRSREYVDAHSELYAAFLRLLEIFVRDKAPVTAASVVAGFASDAPSA